MISALYIDDEPALLEIAKAFLERESDIRVETSTSAMEALVKIETTDFDAVICDYQMPIVDGIQFLKTLRLQGRDIPFILFTGKGREDVVIEALNNGADFYLQKGGDPKTQFIELQNLLKRSVEQRRAAVSIRNSEETFERLFMDNTETMILVDPMSCKIEDANLAAIQFFGYSKAELLSMHAYDLGIPPGEWSRGYADEGPGSGGNPSSTMQLCMADGSVSTAKVYSGTLHVHGRELGYATVHDITEEIESKRREERLNRVFKALSLTGQLIIRSKSESELLEGACGILVRQCGYTMAWIGAYEEEGKTARPVAFVGDDSGVVAMLQRTYSEWSGRRSPTSLVYRTKAPFIIRNLATEPGFEEWAEVIKESGLMSCICLPLTIGSEIVGALSLYSSAPGAFDETEANLLVELASNLSEAVNLMQNRREEDRPDSERILNGPRNLKAVKAAENKLWETGGKLRAIIQTSPLAILSVEPDGSISTWNPAAERIFEWKEPFSVRRFAFLPEAGGERVAELKRQILEGERLTDVEVVYKTGEGQERTISLSTAPILNQAGEVASVIVVASDTSERKRMEDRLIQLNDVLRLVNGILRHDTLSELVVVGGALDMYQKTKQDRFLVTASKAVARSVEMIKRMKELEALATSGGSLREYELRTVAENVLRGYMIEYSVEGSGKVMADEALGSAVDNIVRNAMLHGKAERIDVRIWRENGQTLMSIADDGRGIPDAIKQRIFDEGFSYGSNAGSGLGLYLVSKAVARYGGRLSVEDNRPRGTVLTVAFPDRGTA